MMGQYPRKKSGSTSAPPASQRQGLRKQARPASTTYSGQLETAGSGVIETERPRCFLSELGQRQTMIEEIVERASQESERKFYVRLDALEATLTGKLDSLVQAARAAGGTGTVPSVPLEEAQQSAPGSDTGPDTLKVGRVSDWLRERQADRATSSAGTVRGESIVEEVIAAARPRQTPAEIQQAQGLGKQHTQILEQIRRLKRLERDAEERRAYRRRPGSRSVEFKHATGLGAAATRARRDTGTHRSTRTNASTSRTANLMSERQQREGD
jgi:hypothetical protein